MVDCLLYYQIGDSIEKILHDMGDEHRRESSRQTDGYTISDMISNLVSAVNITNRLRLAKILEEQRARFAPLEHPHSLDYEIVGKYEKVLRSTRALCHIYRETLVKLYPEVAGHLHPFFQTIELNLMI